jgi:hypothetical protein
MTHTRSIALLIALAAPAVASAQVAAAPPSVAVTAQVELPPPPPPASPWGALPPPPPADAAPVYVVAPQPQGVPVRFVAGLTDDEFTVTVRSAAGEQQCHAPCGLMLPVGAAQVRVEGAQRYEQEVFIPPQPTLIRIRRFRAGRMIWGLSGLGVGLAMSVAGVAISSNASTCYTYPCDGPSQGTGTALLLLGSALAVTASTTGFTTMGRNRLEVAPDFGQYARAPSRGPRFAGFGIAPLNGGAVAGASVTF